MSIDPSFDTSALRIRLKAAEDKAKAALYEAEQKTAGLTARINKDYTNSSKSFSQSPSHKTIPNGRGKSGKKPGGQKGHMQNPTVNICEVFLYRLSREL